LLRIISKQQINPSDLICVQSFHFLSHNHGVRSVRGGEVIGNFVDLLVTEVALDLNHLLEVGLLDFLVVAVALAEDLLPQHLARFLLPAQLVLGLELAQEVLSCELDETRTLLQFLVLDVEIQVLKETLHVAAFVLFHIGVESELGLARLRLCSLLSLVLVALLLLLGVLVESLVDLAQGHELLGEELEEGAHLLHENHVHEVVLLLLSLPFAVLSIHVHVLLLVDGLGFDDLERVDVDHLTGTDLLPLGDDALVLGVLDAFLAVVLALLGGAHGLVLAGGDDLLDLLELLFLRDFATFLGLLSVDFGGKDGECLVEI